MAIEMRNVGIVSDEAYGAQLPIHNEVFSSPPSEVQRPSISVVKITEEMMRASERRHARAHSGFASAAQMGIMGIASIIFGTENC